MKTPTRAVLSTLAVGLLMGVSGSAIAETAFDEVETSQSALHLQEKIQMQSGDMERGQMSGTETDRTWSGQAGRAGPEQLPMTSTHWNAIDAPLETRHNALDFARENAHELN